MRSRLAGSWFPSTALLALALAVSPAVWPADAPPASLSLAARARDLAALERVRASHRGGDAAAFDDRYPRELWLEKATEVLRTSLCLAERYGVSVDDEALSRELARMCGSSRAPDRLEELFAALDHDPVRIKEGLVRPVLVDRLLRTRVGWDEEIQGAARAEASALAARLTPDSFEAVAGERLGRASYRLDEGGGSRLPGGGDEPIRLTARELMEMRDLFGPDGVISDPQESEDRITIRLVTEENEFGFDALLVTVPKVRFEGWWGEHGASFAASVDGALLARATPLPPIGVGPSAWSEDSPDALGDPIRGSWNVRNAVPDPRHGHVAVWTGSEMIVWGGRICCANGGRYDPATDSWATVSREGEPLSHTGASGVWSGSELLVWGGSRWEGLQSVYELSGGRYDPVLDRWRPIATEGAPVPRAFHLAVFTDAEMIVWGGSWWDGSGTQYERSGGRYDPASDIWRPTNLDNAPVGRDGATAVWTGSEMIVWGGASDDTTIRGERSGGRYDPLWDTWRETPILGAPVGRAAHSAVWTGAEMIVWGGSWYDGSTHYENSGGRFRPASNSWLPVPLVGAPLGRNSHTAVWTGSEMIVWGGLWSDGTNHYENSGGRYDPVAGTWLATSMAGAPPERAIHTAVWTGTEMLVWGGGTDASYALDSGGRYDPWSDSWLPIDRGNDPVGRSAAVGEWTGSEFLVWGGCTEGVDPVCPDIGERYDPALDSWTLMSGTNAPVGRNYLVGAWTGTELLVWGGNEPGVGGVGTGGRYDPVLDTWQAISLVGGPSQRVDPSSDWTGTELFVWGGWGARSNRSTGGRYDPVTDTWTAVSTDLCYGGGPGMSVIWISEEVFVCGPTCCAYDPAAGSWRWVGLSGIPDGGSYHSAVSTGELMILWGGWGWNSPTNAGGVFDPDTEAWSLTTLDSAPEGRTNAPAIWTGHEMVVWGGDWAGIPETAVDSGGRYDPIQDRWVAMSESDAASARTEHVVAWADDVLYVWGGTPGSKSVAYHPCAVPVIDGPAFFCAGESVLLDAGTGYDSYSWSPGGQSSQAIVVAPTVPTVYTVDVTAGWYGSSASHLLVPASLGDVNADGVLTGGDLELLLGEVYGGPGGCSDLTGDGQVDAADLAAWIAAFTLR